MMPRSVRLANAIKNPRIGRSYGSSVADYGFSDSDVRGVDVHIKANVRRSVKVISDYNEFIRRCNQGRVGSTKTSPDLSQRYRSQQSITKQSEEQGTAQKYQEKIKEEENKEAQEAGADDLAAKRKQLNADQARQKANQAAEKANADAERQPSIMPSATPTSPRVVLESRGFPGSQYYALQRGNPDCVKQNGLNVCTLQTAIDPALTGGKCFDAHLTSSGGRLGTQYCLNRSGSWAGINDGNTSSYQFCVDVICAPDH